MEENKKTAIEKIYQLTKQDAEFNDELRKKLGITSSASSAFIDDDRLNQIYEYCIEDILRKQAENFYDVFKNASFKNNLVSDYIRMERFRRRNEFGDYALALYQQIETILNAIFMDPIFKDAINSMWDRSFYKYIDKSNRTILKTVSSIVFGVDTIDKEWNSEGKKRAENDKLTARDKFKIVLFYFKYFANASYDSKNCCYISNYNYNEYNLLFDSIWDIYSCRNTNHRNPEQNENEKVQSIMKNASFSYFQFNWTLTEFVWLTKDYNNTIQLIADKIPQERKAVITQLLGTIAFAKMEGDSQPTKIPDNLLKKLKNNQINDEIIVIVNSGEICDIK